MKLLLSSKTRKMGKDRVEALEQFKIGNTPLVEIEVEDFGLERILVKDESKNPFGTVKDRKSKHVATQVHASGADYVMAITSGNYGYSLSHFLEAAGVRTLLFVPPNICSTIAERLRERATVIPVDLEAELLTTERMKEIASPVVNLSKAKVIDATNFYDDAYLEIFKEIKMQSGGRKVDYLIVPLGSAELFAAALRYYHLSDTKVIGVTTDFRGTIAKMLYAKHRPIMEEIIRHGNPARYDIIKASEHEIKHAHNWANSHGINSEHSASAAFVALQRYNFRRSDTVFVVNTGNGLKNFG